MSTDQINLISKGLKFIPTPTMGETRIIKSISSKGKPSDFLELTLQKRFLKKALIISSCDYATEAIQTT